MRKQFAKKAAALALAASMAFTSQAFMLNASAQEREASISDPAYIPIQAVTASSSKAGHEAIKAADGIYSDDGNSWMPEEKPTAEANQWLTLDFGESVKVGALEAAVRTADGPKTYEIQVSQNGQDFETVASKTAASNRTLFVEWETVSARYVRLLVKDSFGEGCAVSEVTAFENILPHRVGVLAGFPDMGNFGDAGLEALHRQGQQLVNLCVSISDPASPGINILPDLIDDTKFPNGLSNDEVMAYVSNPDNYSWEYADWIFGKFIDDGFDIWLGFQGFSERAFPEFYTDIVDEDGRVVKHRDFFNSIQNEAVIEIAKQTMLHFDSNPHIRAYSILGPGWFGGIEFYSGSDPERLAVYSDGAQNSFRGWLQEKYGTIGALNRAWGSSYQGFEAVVAPKPIRDNTDAVDSRPDWADLMVWKIDYMDTFIGQYMTTMRSVSDKPIHVEIDGGYQSAPMETGESMGKIVRDFSKYENVIMGNSNLDSAYGPAQFAATSEFYQRNGMTMDDTNQYEEKKQLDNGFNFLSRGIHTLAHCSLGADYSEYSNGKWDPNGEYLGTDIYRYTLNNVNKFKTLDPEGVDSDVVVFNPWYANLFRQGYNKNNHNFVFDSDHGIQWYGAAFANWAHYLNSPDIMDDFPIQDGALEGKKVLLEPNMDVALTSNAAETKIKQWVNDGGAFVGFGKDCFNYSFNEDTGRLEGGDTVENWMMGLSGGVESTALSGSKIKVSEHAPAWLTSLTKGQQASFVTGDDSQRVAFSALESGAVPVLEDEAGNVVLCEKQVGMGSVLFCTLPITNTELFHDGFMSKLLADYADSRNITRTVTYDPEKFHVVDAGADQKTGKRVLTVSRNEAAADSDVLIIEQDGSLDGKEAVIDLNWKKDGVLYHTFEQGKAFVYADTLSGQVSGSAEITRENGKTVITMDLGHSYQLESITLDAENKVESLRFEDGSYKEGWIQNGNAFGSAAARDENGGYLASSADNGRAVGKLTSKLFTVEDNVLAFYAGGYKGSPKVREPITVEDFSSGDWSGLKNVDTSVYGSGPVKGANGYATGKNWDGYYVNSGTVDETLAGALKTNDFVVERTHLKFLEAGYCGPVYGTGPWADYPDGGGNVFRIRDAATDEILIEVQPQNVFGVSGVAFGDFREHSIDLSALQGRKVYFEMDDGITGGFGWFALANIQQYDPAPAVDPGSSGQGSNATIIADFENGTWDELQSVDTAAFGTAPSTSGVPNGAGHYANSAAVSGNQKGSLATKSFVVDRPTLVFQGAGWNGTAYAAGDWPYALNNRYYLKDASTGEILMEQKPENRLGDSDKFMTYTWDVSGYAGRQVYFEMVDAVGAEESAQYGGGFDWLAVDNIMLTGDRFGEGAEVTGYNAYYLKDATGSILRTAYPKDDGGQSLVTWDVSNLKGQQVSFEAIDGMDDAENGWLSFGEVFGYSYKDGPEDNYWSFESGTFEGWERTGDAFPADANSSKLGRPMGEDNGKYWADSLVGGEEKTGTLTSKEFVIEKPFLSFLACGWNGQGGHNPAKNYYELIDAQGNRLRMATPPGQSSQPLNQFIRQYWDVSDLVGQTVRLRMVDGDSGTGYAWLALDGIRQENNFNFESKSFTYWNTAGDAFGSAPATAADNTSARGARDGAWADSGKNSSGKTGSLRSEAFVMENDTLSFLAAGYGCGGDNYYRLLSESGEELARTAPPEEDEFSMLSMTAAGYKGRKVIFEAVDGSGRATDGWLAVDDLNFRFLFPDHVKIETSSDQANWTQAAELSMTGKTFERVAMPGQNSVRYVRLELNREDADLSFLNLVKINQKVETLAESLAVVSGTADLGAAQSFNGLRLRFTGDETRNYQIFASADHETWEPVYQAIAKKGADAEIMIGKVNARYLRFEGDADGLTEVSVYHVLEPVV